MNNEEQNIEEKRKDTIKRIDNTKVRAPEVKFTPKIEKEISIMEKRHFKNPPTNETDGYRIARLEDTLMGKVWEYTPLETRMRRLKLASQRVTLAGTSLPNNLSRIYTQKRIRNDSIELREIEQVGIIDGLLRVYAPDLYEKVRFRNRKKKTTVYKVDKHCLEGRRYEDFLAYMKQHPDTPVIQMDSVEGKKGGKVLLTLHFVNCSLMLAFIRDHNDAQSVIDAFNELQKVLGINKFKELFIVILTDNGSEFSNPTEIEFDTDTKEKRTQIFYCHPSSPHEKGSCEVNHELIRRILPTGTSFDNLSQDDINLMMSHINSYTRKKLNDKSPYDIFSTIYGYDTLNKIGIKKIKPNDVNLTSNLLKK